MEAGTNNDIVIRLRPHERISPDEIAVYRLAGKNFISDTKFATLSPFKLPLQKDPSSLPSMQVDTAFTSNPGIQPIAVEGLVGGIQREVSIVYKHNSCRISMNGIGDFIINAHSIIGFNIRHELTAEIVLMGLLGPPIIIALAYHNIWCLHASAVTIGSNAYLFLGESGDGKSTLARELCKLSGETRQLGDDLMPVATSASRLMCCPGFPQPKLSQQSQIADLKGGTSVKALIILNPAKHNSKNASTELKKLSAAMATGKILKCTMGNSLFNQRLKQLQLHMLSKFIPYTPILQLEYPHNTTAIEETYSLLKTI